MAREVITAAERIQEKFGGGWEKVGKGILKPPPSISTGSLLLDEAIGDCKGYPEGSIIEAFGPQHSGKTLMGYLALAASQKAHPDRDHLILDAENQFKFQARWAKQVGVDVASLFVTHVASAEEAFDKLEMAILGDVQLDKEGNVKKIIKAGNFGVILIDSVTQLTPLEMIHKSMDDKMRMAALAASMSKGLKKLVSAMSVTQSKSIIFFVNQTRANPQAMFGNPEVRTGGTSLPFYDTIAFRVAKVNKSEERDEKGKIFAHKVRIKFDKNKCGQKPADPIIFRLRYDGTGIDNDFELFSVGEMNGLIMKVKRGKYNFVKPGSTEDEFEILDESIENFKEEEFGDVLEKHPKMKESVLNFIKEGSFYSEDFEEESEEKVEAKSDVKSEETKDDVKAEKTEKSEEPEIKRKYRRKVEAKAVVS